MFTKEEAYTRVAELVDRFDEQLTSYKKPEYNEALTRRDFIDPFFRALGWDIDNSQGYSEANREVIHEDKLKVGTATKAPDYSFRLPGGKRQFFLEAKKPSVIVKEDTAPAYQVRRYGWSAKLPISLITDFEEFAVYDCTKRPFDTDKASTARIKYLTYKNYLDDFDFIWNTFSKINVLKGGLEKYIQSDTQKKGTATVDKEFLSSLDGWRIQLALNIALRNKELSEDELNFVVQQIIDRIIFLRIAEDRKVEPYGQLQNLLKTGKEEGAFYKQLYTIFKEADSKYNSGLFDFRKDKLSANITIDNKVIKTIINELYYPVCPYEFSVLGVEILGSAYEQFLGKQIKLDKSHRAVIEEKPEIRKAGGVYYTPQYIVEYIVEQTVGKLAEGKTPEEVAKLKIVDPACGSGSFLLGAYDYLLKWHWKYYTPDFIKLSGIASDNNVVIKQREAAIRQRNKLPLTPEGYLSTGLKKQILLNNIYGVDLDTQAVEVTKLSLLLKCMEGETASSINAEMRFGERVLPTLDNNIKSGNSLIDLDFYDFQIDFGEEKKIKPFNWQQAFPEVFTTTVKGGAKLSSGFDVVIGNPPYIRIQSIIETSPDQATYFNQKYKSAAKGNYDIYVAFIEKSLSLINKQGKVGYILPHKFFTAQYGAATRELLLQKKAIDQIVHFGHQQIFENATTYTCIITLSNEEKSSFDFIKVEDLVKWRTKTNTSVNKISFDTLTTGDWNFVTGSGQKLLEKLNTKRTLESITNRIFQGLKTSADKIYIVRKVEEDANQYIIFSPQNDKSYKVEKVLFHPLIKGGDSLGYVFAATQLLILFPYNNSSLIPESNLKKDYPLTYSYLKEHKQYLEDRENEKMKTAKWYGFVYPKALDVISTPKIFTPDIAPKASYSIDVKGDIFFTGGVSGGYGIKVKEGVSELFILGLLNSKLIDWYLKQISTQMRGGWYSF